MRPTIVIYIYIFPACCFFLSSMQLQRYSVKLGIILDVSQVNWLMGSLPLRSKFLKGFAYLWRTYETWIHFSKLNIYLQSLNIWYVIRPTNIYTVRWISIRYVLNFLNFLLFQLFLNGITIHNYTIKLMSCWV